MRISRSRGLLAAGVAAVMALAGCTSEVGGSDDSGGGGSTSGGTINVGLEQMPGGYNCNNSASNSVYCAYVDNLTQSSLVTVQPDGSLKANDWFGSYKKTSDDPLTVEVTISDDAVWSDGTPIDYDDVLLQWAAFSGTSPYSADDQGNATDVFDAASTNGFEQIEMPEGKPGDKKFTWTFTEPYVDWEALLSTSFIPAHVVAKMAGLSPDDDGAELIEAIQAGESAKDKITAIGQAWSTGMDFEVDVPSLPDSFELLSSGPYQYDNASNGNITLVKNEKFWGDPGQADTFVFKLIDDQEWVQAMANGEIDAFDPSNPTGDTIAQLDAASDTIAYEAGESYTFSHVDFNSGPGGKLEDPLIRQAFMKCMPRQELVDKFAKPVYDGAQVLNLREFLPAQEGYEDILAEVPSAKQYENVDIAGAQQLLTQAGVTQPFEIVLTYAATSSLRAEQAQVIKASCDQAGFVITPKPDQDLFTTLALKDTSWDAAVFGWAGSGLVASGQSIYVTDGEQNYGRYSNQIVDESWAKVVTSTDRDAAEKEKIPMEEALWADLYNAPLYSNPGVSAWSTKLEGPGFNPTQTGLTWNAATWTVS